MSRFLQSILGANEPLFSNGLARLEKSAGCSGVDTRLIADIIEKSHIVMRKLGLDTRDTTGHELYFALMSAVKNDTIEELLFEMDYVLMTIDKKIVSFNLIDVIENSHHQLSFEKQIVSHGQRSLRGELVARYINHARTSEITTREIATLIGLLPEQDACYNNLNNQQKQTGNIPKELIK